MRRGDDVSNRDGKRRPRIDWDAAFAFFCSDSTVSYPKVARKFSVSVTSVGKHARAEHWNDRRAELFAKAVAKAGDKAVRDRAAQIVQMARIRDAAADQVERRLNAKQLDDALAVRALEMAEKYVRLDNDEATDKIEISRVNALMLVTYRAAAKWVPAAHREEFLADLDAATAGMLELGPGDEAVA